MKDETKFLYTNSVGKVIFYDKYSLIGGRVFNPRQQQVAYSRLAREHT